MCIYPFSCTLWHLLFRTKWPFVIVIVSNVRHLLLRSDMIVRENLHFEPRHADSHRLLTIWSIVPRRMLRITSVPCAESIQPTVKRTGKWTKNIHIYSWIKNQLTACFRTQTHAQSHRAHIECFDISKRCECVLCGKLVGRWSTRWGDLGTFNSLNGKSE